MSVEGVTITPMTEDFIVWRCLHRGPLTPQSVEVLPPPGRGPEAVTWEALRARNVPLLTKLVRTYGTCAMLCRDGEAVVGFLRFYPKALMDLPGAGQMCLQQRYPNGPDSTLVDQPFPAIEELPDKTLLVHCLMTGTPFLADNPYQRHGLAKRMVRELASWARDRRWGAIEAHAYEDLAALYEVTGVAGRKFYAGLGFETSEQGKENTEGWEADYLRTLRRQAVAAGLSAADADNAYTMRLSLA